MGSSCLKQLKSIPQLEEKWQVRYEKQPRERLLKIKLKKGDKQGRPNGLSF